MFWGVGVIGFTGLLLWFPTFFTRIIPGWMLNVATTTHRDEAVLAVGFIFTGGMPLAECKRDRPLEYQALVESGRLDSLLMDAPDPLVQRFWRRFGFTALTIGLLLIVLIIYAEIVGYR